MDRGRAQNRHNKSLWSEDIKKAEGDSRLPEIKKRIEMK